jgi:hydrogenase nickel incorporation protein HypA/HybF
MHELSIALSMIDAITENAAQYDGAKVVSVRIRLGPLSGVIKEALVSAYDMAKESTELAESALVIEDVPITVWCPKCQAEKAVPSPQDISCIDCGTPTPDIRSGRELEITALEICDGANATG